MGPGRFVFVDPGRFEFARLEAQARRSVRFIGKEGLIKCKRLAVEKIRERLVAGDIIGKAPGGDAQAPVKLLANSSAHLQARPNAHAVTRTQIVAKHRRIIAVGKTVGESE